MGRDRVTVGCKMEWAATGALASAREEERASAAIVHIVQAAKARSVKSFILILEEPGLYTYL